MTQAEQVAVRFFKKHRLTNPKAAASYFREEAARWGIATTAPDATASEIAIAQAQAESFAAIAFALEKQS